MTESISFNTAVLITFSDVVMFMLLERTRIRVVEAIFAAFITIMGSSFLYMVSGHKKQLLPSFVVFISYALIIHTPNHHTKTQYIRADPDQLSVMKGVLYPWCDNCSMPEINQLVGILGSIVTPHNIFFHSSLVLVSQLVASLFIV